MKFGFYEFYNSAFCFKALITRQSDQQEVIDITNVMFDF